MRKHQIQDLPKGLEISNADDVVDMHDDPASIIHKRKNSSMIVGLKMLADGDADAFVSAGEALGPSHRGHPFGQAGEGGFAGRPLAR